MWSPGELGRSLAANTAPRGPLGEPGQGPPASFVSFRKSYQTNENATRVRFQECFVPSLKLLPSQPLASLAPSSLQRPLPTLETARIPRIVLCQGWAGGAGIV